MRLFSPDSKFMIAMGRLGDLILLNCVYLISCLPIFTIGAANTALYHVVFRMGTDREAGIFKPFFQAFRSNFKQSTGLWLLLLLGGGCAVFDVLLFFQMRGAMQFLCIPFALALLLILLTGAILFPLLSQFQNTAKQSVLNALLMSLGYLPRALLAAVLNVFPLLVYLYSPLLFFQTAFLWVFLYFAAAAYLNTFLLRKIFRPYRPQEQEDSQ